MALRHHVKPLMALYDAIMPESTTRKLFLREGDSARLIIRYVARLRRYLGMPAVLLERGGILPGRFNPGVGFRSDGQQAVVGAVDFARMPSSR